MTDKFYAKLGEYNSHEKAIKVLDKIQEMYEASCYSEDAFDQSAHVHRPYIFMRNVVFQMPTDNEV